MRPSSSAIRIRVADMTGSCGKLVEAIMGREQSVTGQQVGPSPTVRKFVLLMFVIIESSREHYPGHGAGLVNYNCTRYRTEAFAAACSNSHFGRLDPRRVRAPGLQPSQNRPLVGRVPSPGVPFCPIMRIAVRPVRSLDTAVVYRYQP